MSRVDGPKAPIVLATLHDLSREHEIEGELMRNQKLATLGEISGGLTHEISNPLTSVVENSLYIAESIADGDITDDVADAAQETVEAAKRMKTILEEVRRFSHMGRGGKTETTFGEPVRSALMLASHLSKSGVKIIPPQGESAEVRADQGRMTQVILNLVKNASEAIRESGRGTTITLTHGATDTHAWLKISDDGPGIPPAVQQRLFREYITTKEAGRGTGFGLTLCAKLVAEDGGRIELESDVGDGAAFTIFLPLAGLARDSSMNLRNSQGQEITLLSELDPALQEELLMRSASSQVQTSDPIPPSGGGVPRPIRAADDERAAGDPPRRGRHARSTARAPLGLRAIVHP